MDFFVIGAGFSLLLLLVEKRDMDQIRLWILTEQRNAAVNNLRYFYNVGNQEQVDKLLDRIADLDVEITELEDVCS